MKSLALAVFLFLVVPGSGQLVWDGLPLSTRMEFATLVLFLVVIASRDFRERVASHLARTPWRGALRPLILVFALLKLLSFTWYPFSDGFDACYRSIYKPLSNPEACEKSYEGPFLLRSDMGLDNTTRIDRTIDFGTHLYDWSLPFMNDHPRLGAQWLSRFPFSAQFGAVLRNETKQPQYMPIYGNGEIEGTINQTAFSTSDVPLSDRYEFPRVTVVDIPPGLSELSLLYRFTEDDASDIPDVMPPVKGPYAQLKVGRPQTRTELMEFALIRIRGWSLNTANAKTPDFFFAADESGRELGRSNPLSRPDVAAYVGLPRLTESGFSFTVRAASLLNGVIAVRAAYGSESSEIGTIAATDSFVPDLPTISLSPSEGERGEFQVWFDADRNDFAAFSPDGREKMGIGFTLLRYLLDAVAALLFLGLVVALTLIHRHSLLLGLGLGLITYMLLEFGSRISPSILNSRSSIPLLLTAALIIATAWLAKSRTILVYLPTAVALAIYKTFDHLERFHHSQGQRWWGRLLFYWRDSDWYTIQGNARSLFVTGSWRAGEPVFWFNVGPRYLAYVTRSLLGENDVLVGIISISLGFFALFILISRFAHAHADWATLAIVALVSVIGIMFLSGGLMISFGFFVSSEYPTWIVLLGVTAFVIHSRHESRTWIFVALSFALGYSVQSRHNQVVGLLLLFIALIFMVDRTDKQKAIATISAMTATFGTVCSLALLHNLYYGESFVLFSANSAINEAFSWRDVLGLSDGDASWGSVWKQARYMMYWNPIGNYSWALMFWGSQLCWIGVVAYRLRHRLALRARSLYLLIPFGYALPMLKYQMTSYYPRHLVVINLSFLCAALMAWPRNDENPAETRVEDPALSAANP